MAPYVSISSVASASYSFEGILGENKNITSEKEREIAEMRTQFSIPVASWKYLYKLPPLTKWDHVFIGYPEYPYSYNTTKLLLAVNIYHQPFQGTQISTTFVPSSPPSTI